MRLNGQSKPKVYRSKPSFDSILRDRGSITQQTKESTSLRSLAPLKLEEKWHLLKSSFAFKLAMICLVVIIGLSFYFGGQASKDDPIGAIASADISAENTSTSTTLPAKKIIVYVTGAVNAPGVVETTDGSRIFQVIQMAGGVNDQANLTSCDMAQKIVDGATIYVPRVDENVSCIKGVNAGGIGQSSSSTTNIINLNIATQAELEALPGVGPSLATAIIGYREENGSFGSVNDLRKVSGIGDKKFADIKDLVTV